MKKGLLIFSLLCGGLLCMTDISFGHGGQYRGPRDVVPPGGNSPTGPSTPSTPSGPSTPTGPATPASPATPAGPATPAPTTAAPTSGPVTGTPRGIDLTASLSVWDFWWEFNRERFLNLKRRIFSVEPTTESDEFYLGIMNKGSKNLIGISRDQVKTRIYPAIKKILENREGPPVRMRDELSSALVCLGKFGIDSKDSLELMKRYLKDGDQEVSETAVISMGILADPEAVPILKDLLLDTERGRQLVGRHEVSLRHMAFAAYGLGLIGYNLGGDNFKPQRKEISDLLIRRLETDSSAIKDIKISTIIALGLIPNDPDVIEGDVAPVLMKWLNDKKSKNIDLVRAHVPTALMRMSRHLGENQALPKQWTKHFLKMLRDKKENLYVRQSLVLALGQLVQEEDENYNEAIATLLKVQEDGRTPQERYFTGIVLGQIGGKKAISHLVKEVVKGKQLYRPWAALGLGIHGYKKSEAGGVALDPGIRLAINQSLKKTKAPEYKGAYAISLGLLKDLTSTRLLLAEMADANVESYKGYLGVALGLMRAVDAVDDIRAEVKKSTRKPDQLRSLAIGLGLLGDKDIVQDLIEMMKEARTTSVYAAIAQALGFIGDARSIDPLLDLAAKGPSGEARAFAIVALGIVGDKEEFPWNTKISENMNYRASVTSLTGSAVGILDIL